MTMFTQVLVSGLVIGCVYGLIALGYSLIYKASGMMSFTQGDLLTVGAFLGYTFYGMLKIPFAISFVSSSNSTTWSLSQRTPRVMCSAISGKNVSIAGILSDTTSVGW